MRNTDGVSRMTLLGVAVDAGTNTISSGDRFTLDLSTADILADKLWLGRCRPRQSPNANAHIYGTLTYRGGTLDVNTAVLGYQIATNDNDCRGILNITNGTLVVNNLMVLGYSFGDFVTNGSYAFNGGGQLNLAGGAGRANLNAVTVGGPGKVSANNTILVSASANLTLTNIIGAPDGKLNQLAFNAASLMLHLNGTAPRIYTKNVTTLGTCLLNIAAITNTGAYPVEIPLISYETQSANFTLGPLPFASPVAYQGYLTNDASLNCICLVLTAGPWQPGPVTWVGNVNGNWDLVTTNWLNGGTPYQYADGITARFDDSGLTGNVNLPTALAPADTTVSNNSLAYTFSGSGKLTGSGGLIKQGAGTFTIANSGNNDFIGAITVAGGTFQIGNGGGDGSLGAGNLTNNAALVFNRTGNLTVVNVISGTGTLTQNGAGTVGLTGAEHLHR